MSLARLVFPNLNFAELWSILNFLSYHDLYMLGATCRTSFVTFMRERDLRGGYKQRKKERQTLRDADGATAITSLIDDARFLSKYSSHEKVLLVSYPRSGNSYVRKLLELTTGVVTGSDSRPNRALTSSLLRYGYKGEGITDQSVWVVKSHYPERLGYIRVPVKRVILVVRNPFDAIESYFHMGMTNSHDKVLSAKAFSSLREIWDKFLVNEAEIWKAFHNFWIERLGILPIMIVRYEDLLHDEAGFMRAIIEFLQSGNPPVGVQRYCPSPAPVEIPSNKGPGYKPKNRKIGKAMAKMSLHQAKEILTKTDPLFRLFGYDIKVDSDLSVLEPADQSMELEVKPNDFGQVWKESLSSHFSVGNGAGQIIANDLINIRDNEDPFGRKLSDTRQKLTNNDKEPFETD